MRIHLSLLALLLPTLTSAATFDMPLPDERIEYMRRPVGPVLPYFSAGLVVFPETGQARFPDVWYDTARVHGSTHSRAAVVGLRDRLAALTLDERVGPVLPRRRADVIVAGLTILLAVMDQCGAEVLEVRDRGLRYALVEAPVLGG